MNKTVERIASPRPRKAPSRPRTRTSNRLAETSPAAPPPTAVEPASTVRHDGWTPERQRVFLEALAACGVVEDAARAAGMSKQSAYAFRSRANGRGFHLGWIAAQRQARHVIADELMSRALNGCVELIYRDGQLWGERHRFDNRLTLALHTRLAEEAGEGGQDSRTIRHIAEEFDEYLDCLVSGEGGAVADFVEAREAADRYPPCKEGRLLRRLDRFQAEGAGLDPAEEEEEEYGSDYDETDYDDDGSFGPDKDGGDKDRPAADANPAEPSTSSTSLETVPEPVVITDIWPPDDHVDPRRAARRRRPEPVKQGWMV